MENPTGHTFILQIYTSKEQNILEINNNYDNIKLFRKKKITIMLDNSHFLNVVNKNNKKLFVSIKNVF